MLYVLVRTCTLPVVFVGIGQGQLTSGVAFVGVGVAAAVVVAVVAAVRAVAATVVLAVVVVVVAAAVVVVVVVVVAVVVVVIEFAESSDVLQRVAAKTEKYLKSISQ